MERRDNSTFTVHTVVCRLWVGQITVQNGQCSPDWTCAFSIAGATLHTAQKQRSLLALQKRPFNEQTATQNNRRERSFWKLALYISCVDTAEIVVLLESNACHAILRSVVQSCTPIMRHDSGVLIPLVFALENSSQWWPCPVGRDGSTLDRIAQLINDAVRKTVTLYSIILDRERKNLRTLVARSKPQS